MNRGIVLKVHPPEEAENQGENKLGRVTSPPGRTRPSPQLYAARIQEYVDQEADSKLFSSINYRQLAAYLNAPYLVYPKQESQTTATNVRGASVHLSSLTEEQKSSIVSYDDINGLDEFNRDPPTLTVAGVHLVWLQGLPSAEWINTLGAQYRIDPEYFRRHLRFLQPKDNFDHPALPSSSPNSVTIRLTTICTRNAALSRQALEVARNDAEHAAWIYQHNSVTHQRHGSSIVRKYHILDNSMFAIEQEVSIYVKRRRNGWIAIACLDIGSDEETGKPLPPWLEDEAGLTPVPLPVLPQKPKIALQSHMKERPPVPAQPASKYLSQAGRQLPFHVSLVTPGNALDLDVRDSLHEIFEFSAAAECQFLNLMDKLIDRELKQQTSDTETEWTLGNLRYFKDVIDSHVVYLDEILSFLNVSDPASEWTPHPETSPDSTRKENVKPSSQKSLAVPGPQRSPNSDNQNRPRSASPTKSNSHISSILLDHAHLRAQALRLSTRCLHATEMLVSMAMLEESKTAIQQANGIIRLTSLAFVFLPLSLTTSFFGMNFRELGTGKLRMWISFVTGFLVLVPSLVVGFWDVKAFGRLRHRIMKSRERNRTKSYDVS